MEIENIRDYIATIGIFGMFAFAWLGWAQDGAPKSWRIFLGIGSVIGFILASVSIALFIKNIDAVTALEANNGYRTFGIIVAVEVGLIVAGAIALSLLHKSTYVSTWVALVVAIHFIPLVYLFKDAGLWILTIIATIAAIAPVFIAKATGISLPTLTGVCMGLSLIIFSVRAFVIYLMH